MTSKKLPFTEIKIKKANEIFRALNDDMSRWHVIQLFMMDVWVVLFLIMQYIRMERFTLPWDKEQNTNQFYWKVRMLYNLYRDREMGAHLVNFGINHLIP